MPKSDDEIIVGRELVGMTGLSRSEIRKGLSDFAQRQLAARLSILPKVQDPVPFKLPTGDTKFETKPFRYSESSPRTSTSLPPSDLTSGDPTIGGLVYSMRSKKFGSEAPDDDTGPLSVAVANPDTFKSWDPPHKTKVSVVSIIFHSTTQAKVKATAHGIPATGGPFVVILDSTDATPDVNGRWIVQYFDADNFYITNGAPITASGGAAGTAALIYNAVDWYPGIRYVSVTSEGTYVFADILSVDHGFYNLIYDIFRRKETKYIGGHFMIGPEESDNQLCSATFNAT